MIYKYLIGVRTLIVLMAMPIVAHSMQNGSKLIAAALCFLFLVNCMALVLRLDEEGFD